jgi:predicted nucleotide-binding protein
MIIREIEILSEALWEAIKTDLKFFAPIQTFVKKLSEYDLTTLTEDNVNELKLYIEKINEFFSRYRPTGDHFYIPPSQASRNDKTVKDLNILITRLSTLSPIDFQDEVSKIKPSKKSSLQKTGAIFVGHGRSQLWARLLLFLKEDLDLDVEILCYESESHTSDHIGNIIDDFLEKATFAIIIMTAEDVMEDLKRRARQNVVHETGLFQGRLGFENVVVLRQDETEEFSNNAGMQYIPFVGENIEQTFYELQRKLKKNGFIK